MQLFVVGVIGLMPKGAIILVLMHMVETAAECSHADQSSHTFVPMSVIRQFYGYAPALLTDLYQLTMTYAHWYNGTGAREAVFHLFFRNAPLGNRFALASGLVAVIDFIAVFWLDITDLSYFASLTTSAGDRLSPDEFLTYLRDLAFPGDIHARPEATAVSPPQPMLPATAPIIQAQLL